MSYLLGDHLGGASAVVDGNGTVLSYQRYTPWGEVRVGDTPTTTLDFTGQRRDDSGLLFYNARYYDPALGRFLSADTVVPGSGALTKTFIDTVEAEAWAAPKGGTANPQDLNRYSYTNNNPVTRTDSSGHIIDTIVDVAFIACDVYDIAKNGYTADRGLALAADVAGALIPGVTGAGAAVRAAKATAQAVNRADAASDIAKAAKAGTAIPPKAPGLCGQNSFRASTPVATPTGAVPIAQLHIGDLVLAWNETTQTTGVYTVIDTIHHVDPLVVHVVIDGEALETTLEHPFYTVERGWVAATDLRPGERVLQRDGTAGVIQSLALEARVQPMYNLTIAEAHTFFVGAGEWLVHNANCREFSKFLDNGASILASVDDEGILWTALEVPKSLQGKGIGKGLFGEAWDALGNQASAIGGKWNTGMPDNLNSFNENIKLGMSPERAAINTFTGKQAQRRGFNKVELSKMRKNASGIYTNVEVVFR